MTNHTTDHIILFAPSVDTGGGTERVLADLATMLQQEGYMVTILCSIRGTNPMFQLNPEIPVHLFPFASFRDRHSGSIFVKIISKLLGQFLLTRFLQQYVRKETKAIISFSADITNDCFKTRFGHLVMAFEHFPFEAYDSYPKAQQQIRKQYPHLRKVIVLTAHQEHKYREMGCNVVRIPNTYSFCPSVPAALNNKIVLSVGHLSSIKRRDLLITAWKEVAAAYPDWQLHIIGEGPEKQQLQQQINQLQLGAQVQLLNATSNVEQHYNNASVFVLTSAFESFSLVLLEAKVSGIPCVSFDVVCGPNELIREGVDGFLVPFGDTGRLAERIKQLIGDTELRKSMGEKAREDALNRYNPMLIKQQWLSLLKNS